MKILSYNFEPTKENGLVINYALIEDNESVIWVYDSTLDRQLRVPYVNEPTDNGWWANSFDEAIILLKKEGYI